MNNLAGIESAPSPSPCPEARPTAVGHVLVCLDRSASSDVCLPYAQFVAEAFGAKVTLFHVMPSPRATHEPDRIDALEWEIAKKEAEQYLSHARTSLGSSLAGAVTHLTQGHPAEQIVAASRELAADLTILSSHGEGGDGSPELGSTAQHVLALGAGSILLVPTVSAGRIPPKRLLVPLDGSLRSECVLPLVADLARVHGAEVLLVHVVTDPTPTAVLSAPDDLRLAFSLASRMQANAEAYFSRIRARLLPDVAAVQTLVMRRGEERQSLLDTATQHGADMLILTAHGSTCNVERAFGSVASYVLAHARLPILVLQDMPRGRNRSMPGQAARASLSTRPLEAD